jgi:UTP-glucose-1-phosphate uridylyltransferase
MKPVNPSLPKELLPVGEYPAIHYAIAEGSDIGVKRIVVVLNQSKQRLLDYLTNLDVPITFVYQEQPTGEADAVALAQEIGAGHAVAVVYPDNIYLPTPGALRRLTAVFEHFNQDVVALSRVTAQNETRMGHSGQVELERLDGEVYRIRRLFPKQPGHFVRRYPQELRTSGMMIAGEHLFETIRRARLSVSEGEFTDEPVRALLTKERGLLGVSLPGTIHDIGNPAGYANCLRHVGTS